MIVYAKNMNKNPVAKRAIQELGLELLRMSLEGGPMSAVTLALVTSRMNSRIRAGGLSAQEIWTQHDQMSGSQLAMSDKTIINQQARHANHPASAKSKSRCHTHHSPKLHVGALVYLKGDRDKCRAREKYMVVQIDNDMCMVRKLTQSQF